jgi:gas vesicle protein
MDMMQKVFGGGRTGARAQEAGGVAGATAQLDYDKVLGQLAQLERQLAKSDQRRGGGVAGTLKVLTVGSLLGGGLALLYAPQTGEQTRRQLLQRGTQLKDQATQVADQARQAAGQATDQAASPTAQSPGAAPASAQPPTPAARAVSQQRRDLASGQENPA